MLWDSYLPSLSPLLSHICNKRWRKLLNYKPARPRNNMNNKRKYVSEEIEMLTKSQLSKCLVVSQPPSATNLQEHLNSFQSPTSTSPSLLDSPLTCTCTHTHTHTHTHTFYHRINQCLNLWKIWKTLSLYSEICLHSKKLLDSHQHTPWKNPPLHKFHQCTQSLQSII